jgi:hypothetical protein
MRQNILEQYLFDIGFQLGPRKKTLNFMSFWLEFKLAGTLREFGK